MGSRTRRSGSWSIPHSLSVGEMRNAPLCSGQGWKPTTQILCRKVGPTTWTTSSLCVDLIIRQRRQAHGTIGSPFSQSKEWGNPTCQSSERGSNGVTAFCPEGRRSPPAFKVKVVDTTGAWDVFDAGFIAARLRGVGIGDALTYASAVAGIKVTRPGARAVPTHAEVVRFLATNA